LIVVGIASGLVGFVLGAVVTFYVCSRANVPLW
jgi:hypothetical protein